ncbi:hypothetical protein ACOMHN_033935 [Nucella lapillus]
MTSNECPKTRTHNFQISPIFTTALGCSTLKDCSPSLPCQTPGRRCTRTHAGLAASGTWLRFLAISAFRGPSWRYGLTAAGKHGGGGEWETAGGGKRQGMGISFRSVVATPGSRT